MKTTDLHIVTSTSLIEILKVHAHAKRPAFVWGSPGIGKSDVIRQVLDQLDALMIDIRASQWDAVDTRGVPFVDAGKTRWAVPSIFPDAMTAAAYPIVGIFLDELNTAAPSVQAALYQLILDRRLGEYELPENAVIFAAGNLETDRAIANRMSTALANRFSHYQLAIDNRAWEDWALRNDIHPALIAYYRYRPANLHLWDAKSSSKAQATPRTAEIASDLIKSAEQLGINGEIERAMIAGTLGEAVAAELCGFMKIYRKLPDPDAIILAPDSAALIEADPAVNYALALALAARATENNFGRIATYAERMKENAKIGPEFSTLLVKAATSKNPKVSHTKAFIQWAAANRDVLL